MKRPGSISETGPLLSLQNAVYLARRHTAPVYSPRAG